MDSDILCKSFTMVSENLNILTLLPANTLYFSFNLASIRFFHFSAIRSLSLTSSESSDKAEEPLLVTSLSTSLIG